MKWLFLIVAVIIILLLIEVLFKLVSLEDDIKSIKFKAVDIENYIKDVLKELYRIEKILTVDNTDKLLEVINNLNNLVNSRFDSQDNAYEILKQHLLELKSNLSSDSHYIQGFNSIITQLDSLKAQTFKQIEGYKIATADNRKYLESLINHINEDIKEHIDDTVKSKKAKNSSKNNGVKKVSPQGELSQNKAKNS